ncbi:EamA-like transporter family protein [Roseovarius litorisediminis]|uniref:EamA-like transporter family protein n=1 Tax=Roseovarius litorisediminis TaxID=1312363 RepID=A0A1Y5RN32_9RHOB|nr:DMT family transporter [Roseovarius litorisediminis]SLN21370.1 EamA-like transporter family protein [Roseovarius litorisediminis]
MVSENPLTPVLLAFFAAALWGIWWIPIRYLEHLGLDGSWGGVAMNSGAFLAALIWVVFSPASFRVGLHAILGAGLVGVAVTTYSTAITMSEVVRVILLFYLAPAWSKIIEWVFMGRGWHWSSTLTVAASLGGAYLVLGGQVSLAAIGLGDLLAVLSGMAWAAGAALIFTSTRSSPTMLTMVTAISATLFGLCFVWLGVGTSLSGGSTGNGMATGAVFGAIYVLPIMALTLWSAQRLSPSVISFLLTAEILSGVLTGALFLDEPFGPQQVAGACMIFLAAVAEVLPGTMRKISG